MEDLLNSVNETEQCYKKYSLEEVRQMSASELQSLCIEERTKAAKYISQLSMQTLITERAKLLLDQVADAKAHRREQLNQFYKL